MDSSASTTSVNNKNNNVKSPAVPWKEMFLSASFRIPKSDPFLLAPTTDLSPTGPLEAAVRCSSESCGLRSLSLDHNPHRSSVNLEPVDSPTVPWQAMFRTASFRSPVLSPRIQNAIEDNAASTANTPRNNPTQIDPPLEDRNDTVRSSLETSETTTTATNNKTESEEQRTGSSKLLSYDTCIWIVVYITLGQAILTFVISISHGVSTLLEEYIRPIIWASLCSIPLRGIQDTLVEFWSEPLSAGLIDAFLAVPVAILRAFAGTIIDARDVFSWAFYGEKLEGVSLEKNGFLRLVRRLVSFSLFVFAYEQIGRFGAFTLIGLGFMFSSHLAPSTISAVSTLRSDSFCQRRSSRSCDPQRQENNSLINLHKISKFVSQWILSRLKTILAVALIIGMIIGSFGGLVFFTYQIGAEGKDAVISMKSHLKDTHYAENIHFKKWIHENYALELIDWYTSECYESLLLQIDNFASRYNLSELIEVMKQSAVTPYYTDDFPENSSLFFGPPQATKYSFNLRNLMERQVLNKAKCLATQGMDLWFLVLTNSKFILDGSAHFVVYIGHIIVSGAAGLTQFLVQSTVFFWVLYYLLTSESGGVTEQVMKVLPLPKAVKERCVEALNNAISGVLLATAEIAIFQGCFTWLLYRLFSVHFVYMSTMLAFVSPLVPIFPGWVITLAGAVELVLDGRYVLAISFCITHVLVMDYGASEIAEYVPGYTTYLTGASIIGGMTLFPSALEVIFSNPFSSYLLALIVDFIP